MAKVKTKSWHEKMQVKHQPHVDKTEKDFAGIPAGQKLLIPTPQLIDAYIREIPKGTHTSVITLRQDLARQWQADATCPLTTGIFLRIVAEAAYEAYNSGKPISTITPFWRVITANSTTAKKLSFGTGFLQQMQKEEGLK